MSIVMFAGSPTEEIVDDSNQLEAAVFSGRSAVFLTVTLPATASKVKISYDPVSVEAARQTREINTAIRIGYVPPERSTSAVR